MLLQESRDKFRGWVSLSSNAVVDVSFKKVADGHPLRLWKFCVDVEAPPDIVLDRIKDERLEFKLLLTPYLGFKFYFPFAARYSF